MRLALFSRLEDPVDDCESGHVHRDSPAVRGEPNRLVRGEAGAVRDSSRVARAAQPAGDVDRPAGEHGAIGGVVVSFVQEGREVDGKGDAAAVLQDKTRGGSKHHHAENMQEYCSARG